MKKIVLLSLFAFALAVNPAYATRIDLVNTAGLGVSQATFSDTTTVGPYTITIDAEVFLSGGIYSYVYEMSTNHAPPNGVNAVTIQTDGFPSTLALNAAGFDFGVISANAADYPRLFNVFSGGNLTFLFPDPGLTAGNPLTVYAQSDLPPTLAPFFGQNNGQASGADTLAPSTARVPDSGSTLAFLGLALIGVAVAQKMLIS